MSTTMSRRLGAAVAAGAVIVGLAVGAAPAASAEEGVDFVGPNSTSLELNGYPGLVGNSGFPVECVQRALLREPDGDYGQDSFDAIRRTMPKNGRKVDGAEIARTVPGTDLLTMFGCLRHGPS